MNGMTALMITVGAVSLVAYVLKRANVNRSGRRHGPAGDGASDSGSDGGFGWFSSSSGSDHSNGCSVDGSGSDAGGGGDCGGGGDGGGGGSGD